MTRQDLIAHLHADHGIDQSIAEKVIGGDPADFADEWYLRGFHDGQHGRVDADDLAGVGHDTHGWPA